MAQCSVAAEAMDYGLQYRELITTRSQYLRSSVSLGELLLDEKNSLIRSESKLTRCLPLPTLPSLTAFFDNFERSSNSTAGESGVETDVCFVPFESLNFTSSKLDFLP
jgi:hypothetical protein